MPTTGAATASAALAYTARRDAVLPGAGRRRCSRCARPAQQLGWGFQLQSPAVVAVLAALFTLIGLNLAGVFEFGTLAPSSLCGAQAQAPGGQRLPLGRARGGDRLALHRAVHGRLAGLRDRAAGRAGAADVRGARLRPGAALPGGRLRAGRRAPAAAARRRGWTRCAGCWPSRCSPPSPGWSGCWASKAASTARARCSACWCAWRRSSGRCTLRGPHAASWWPACWSRCTAVLAGAIGGNVRAQRGARRGRGGRRALAALVGRARERTRRRPAGRCSSTSPPPGASPASTTSRPRWPTRRVLADFDAKKVAMLRADWTRRDPAITAALTALGRSGVPVYVLQAPGKRAGGADRNPEQGRGPRGACATL